MSPSVTGPGAFAHDVPAFLHLGPRPAEMARVKGDAKASEGFGGGALRADLVTRTPEAGDLLGSRLLWRPEAEGGPAILARLDPDGLVLHVEGTLVGVSDGVEIAHGLEESLASDRVLVGVEPRPVWRRPKRTEIIGSVQR